MSQPPLNPPLRPVEHPVPAEQDSTAQKVAEILMVTTTAAGAIAGILAILAVFGIGRKAVEAAFLLSGAGKALRPRPPLARHGITDRAAKDVVRDQARREIYFRAAYLVAAAGRIQGKLDAGKTLTEAIRAERTTFVAHGRARKKRLDAAAKVALAAQQFGPLLGWYRDPESNSEADCLAADGHNFEALKPPVIGFPGSVHPNCACVPGPPHEGAGMVDDALAGVIRLVPRKIFPTSSRRAI